LHGFHGVSSFGFEVAKIDRPLLFVDYITGERGGKEWGTLFAGGRPRKIPAAAEMGSYFLWVNGIE
jgi:hypothetical protein